MRRLPDAVAAHCFSFLGSRSHSRCARTCVWFRKLALLPNGFPEVVRVRSTRHLWERVTPALAQMRPRAMLQIALSYHDRTKRAGGSTRRATSTASSHSSETKGGGDATALGRIGQLLCGQSRVRHLRLTGEHPTYDLANDQPIDLREEVLRADYAIDDDGDLEPTAPTVSAVMDVGVKNDLGGIGGGGGGENALEDLSACERLDLRFLPVSWRSCVFLVRRLPRLRHLECAWFEEDDVEELVACAPNLTALRIVDNSESTVLGFVPQLLASLPALRSLELPYAFVALSAFAIAAERLETLQVRVLIHVRRSDQPAFILGKLRRLSASMYCREAHHILARMPNLAAGRLTLTSDHIAGGFVTRLHADLNLSEDDGDGGDGAASGRICWSYGPDYAGEVLDADLRDRYAASILGCLAPMLAEMRWCSDHRVDATVPTTIRDAIVEHASAVAAVKLEQQLWEEKPDVAIVGGESFMRVDFPLAPTVAT